MTCYLNEFKEMRYILLVLFCEILAAEVAYLPLLEPDVFHPNNTALEVYDLNEGLRFKKLEIGQGTGPVFLNDAQDIVFVAAAYDNKIVAIDATTLTIIEQWDNLPTYPEEIFLSQDNNKLYFINLGVGTGQNSLYQLNLITDLVSEVLTYPGFSIDPVVFSENLQFMTLRINDDNNNDHRLLTYQTNDLALIYDTAIVANDYLVMIDNAGENFYYTDAVNDQLVSKKLSDATENWRFSFAGETSYSSYMESVGGFLMVRGVLNHYLVNKQSGTGSPIPRPANEEPVSYFGALDQNAKGQLIVIDHPEVICVTGWCSLSSRLNIRLVDVFNNNNQLLYQSSNTLGSRPVGRFVGQRLFTGEAGEPVPVFGHLWVLALLLSLFVFIGYRKL